MYVHSFSYLVNKLELGGYTYLQLKNIIFKNFFEGGAQNLTLPPGARYPRYATDIRGGTIRVNTSAE